VQNSQNSNVGGSVGLSQRGMVRVYPGLARQRWAVSSYGKHDGTYWRQVFGSTSFLSPLPHSRSRLILTLCQIL
jgi:hypothetical protein